MKRFVSILLFSPALSVLALNVGTDPMPKNALIEEYTGIHCPNCPDGHRVAADLMARHPGEVYSVAIHAGAFAVPAVGQPDFRTEVGEALNDYYDVTSYPCGIVNRTDTGDGIILSRSSWGAGCREVIKTLAPVNLWAKAKLNGTALTVDVEGYFTEAIDGAHLHCFLLQSEILGPQSGGQLGEEYPHRHMLRDVLTGGIDGMPIATSQQGESFSTTLNYTLGSAINGIESDAANTELILFVTNAAGEVCQVIDTRIEGVEDDVNFVVGYTAAPIAIGKNYAFDFLEVLLFNYGGVEVTSAEFDFTLNGDKKSYEWVGGLAPHSSALIKIPVGDAIMTVCDNESNTYTLKLMRANGIEVESKSITGKYNEIAEYPAEFDVEIKTDLNAGDNTWRILDEHGDVVTEFGPFPEGEITEYTGHASLEEGKIYCLEVADMWGDGICHPLGYLKLRDMQGNQLVQYKEMRGNGFRQFFRATAPAGIESVVSTQKAAKEYFDMMGHRLLQPAPGVSIVKTINADESVTITKQINH